MTNDDNKDMLKWLEYRVEGEIYSLLARKFDKKVDNLKLWFTTELASVSKLVAREEMVNIKKAIKEIHDDK